MFGASDDDDNVGDVDDDADDDDIKLNTRNEDERLPE